MENRKVYFEGWGIDEVAEKIAVDYELQRWIAPRRHPPYELTETLCIFRSVASKSSRPKRPLC